MLVRDLSQWLNSSSDCRVVMAGDACTWVWVWGCRMREVEVEGCMSVVAVVLARSVDRSNDTERLSAPLVEEDNLK